MGVNRAGSKNITDLVDRLRRLDPEDAERQADSFFAGRMVKLCTDVLEGWLRISPPAEKFALQICAGLPKDQLAALLARRAEVLRSYNEITVPKKAI